MHNHGQQKKTASRATFEPAFVKESEGGTNMFIVYLYKQVFLYRPNLVLSHCKKSMVILTNKNGYLSCTFVLSTLDTEQRYKKCARCVGYHPGVIER